MYLTKLFYINEPFYRRKWFSYCFEGNFAEWTSSNGNQVELELKNWLEQVENAKMYKFWFRDGMYVFRCAHTYPVQIRPVTSDFFGYSSQSSKSFDNRTQWCDEKPIHVWLRWWKRSWVAVLLLTTATPKMNNQMMTIRKRVGIWPMPVDDVRHDNKCMLWIFWLGFFEKPNIISDINTTTCALVNVILHAVGHIKSSNPPISLLVITTHATIICQGCQITW